MDGPHIAYMKNSELPEEKTEACILRLKKARYVLYDDKLYRRGYSMLLLKCVLPTEAKNIMWEFHKGQHVVVVAIEYFIKWVKAEALASITHTKIREFIYRNIICYILDFCEVVII